MDIPRARKLMQQQGIDALLVAGPENVAYTTGAPIGQAHQFRRFGPHLALIPADPAITTVALTTHTEGRVVREAGKIDEVRTHEIWVEFVDITEQPAGDIRDQIMAVARDRSRIRPTLYDLNVILRELRALLDERRLRDKRIGVDLNSVPASDLGVLHQVIDPSKMVDSSQLICELRLIKSAAEIEKLRTGVKLTEAGIKRAKTAVGEGNSIKSVSSAFKRGVVDAAEEMQCPNLTGSWDLVTVGDRAWSAARKDRIAKGDIVKFDCGAIVGNYVADLGRTFVCGGASKAQTTVFDALCKGLTAARNTIKPGVPFSDIFRAAESTIRGAGFPTYTRGHFGHSLGSDVGIEEWPLISRTESRVIEPNMVLALEAPFYIDGVGGFMLEHNVVVHEEDIEVLDSLPLALEELG